MPVILYNGKRINFVCVKMSSVLFLRNSFPAHAFFINPSHPFHSNINRILPRLVHIPLSHFFPQRRILVEQDNRVRHFFLRLRAENKAGLLVADEGAVAAIVAAHDGDSARGF